MTSIKKVSSEEGFYILPERFLIRVMGNDRLRYLNGQVTNDLKRLLPGQAMQACLLTPKGKLSAVIWVMLQENALLLEAPLALSEEFSTRLERYLVADDVTLEAVPSEPTIHVFGELLNHEIFKKIPGIFISRLNLPAKDFKVSKLPDSFFKQYQPLSDNEVESIRIEQGIPQWGKELTPDRLPLEAHLERQAIDSNKGCYVGQEVISRLLSVGHVNRLLISLATMKMGEVLVPGMRLFSKNREKSIGYITSAIQQAKTEKFVALGYVTRDYAVSGKELLAGNEEGVYEVVVR